MRHAIGITPPRDVGWVHGEEKPAVGQTTPAIVGGFLRKYFLIRGAVRRRIVASFVPAVVPAVAVVSVVCCGCAAAGGELSQILDYVSKCVTF